MFDNGIRQNGRNKSLNVLLIFYYVLTYSTFLVLAIVNYETKPKEILYLFQYATILLSYENKRNPSESEGSFIRIEVYARRTFAVEESSNPSFIDHFGYCSERHLLNNLNGLCMDRIDSDDDLVMNTEVNHPKK
jgi:hypothetical protein